jgi:hypothetical protein
MKPPEGYVRLGIKYRKRKTAISMQEDRRLANFPYAHISCKSILVPQDTLSRVDKGDEEALEEIKEIMRETGIQTGRKYNLCRFFGGIGKPRHRRKRKVAGKGMPLWREVEL